MARTTHRPPADALEELDSLAHRLSDWIVANRWLALGVIGAILLAAAATAGYLSWSRGQEVRASDAVAAVRDEFVVSMGGTPGDWTAPEPANPDIARDLRQEFANRFLEVARQHAGTAAALEARLQAGALLEELGELDPALEVWQQGVAEAPGSSPVRGLLLERIAGAHEAAGRFAEAAEAHERAAAVETFPLRHLALAEAARSWAEAGDVERALATYARVRTEAPDLALPEHLRARLEELEAARSQP